MVVSDAQFFHTQADGLLDLTPDRRLGVPGKFGV